jgi:hypothetical protein
MIERDDVEPLVPIAGHTRVAGHILQERQVLRPGGFQGLHFRAAGPTGPCHQPGRFHLFPERVQRVLILLDIGQNPGGGALDDDPGFFTSGMHVECIQQHMDEAHGIAVEHKKSRFAYFHETGPL